MELSTQLLQDMLDGKYDIQNPSKVEQIDENNNNGETTYLINNHKYSFVVLDEIVEEILLTLDEELFNACFPFDKVMLRCFIMELRQKTHYPLGSDWGYCGGLTFDLGVLVTLSYLMNGSLDLLVQLIYFQGYSADNLKRCVEKMCQTFVHFLSPTYVK